MNIFDSGASAAKVEIAQQDLLIAGEGLAAIEDGIALRVRTATYYATASWSELQRTNAALDFAAERERNAAVAYENELITRQEALLAQIGLLAAELERSVTLYAFEMALTAIEHLAGVTLSEDL